MGEVVAFSGAQSPGAQVQVLQGEGSALVDLDAERAVLAAVLRDGSPTGCVVKARVLLPSGAPFAGTGHGEVWDVMLSLADLAQPITRTTVAHELRARRCFNAVGGHEGLDAIGRSSASKVWITSHAQIVAELAARRRIVEYGRGLARRAADLASSLVDVRDGAAKALREIPVPGAPVATLGDDLIALWERSDAIGRGEVSYHLPTGVRGLDRILGGGFVGGKVYLLAARPRVGKTALAVQVGLEVAARGLGVYMASLEIAAEDLARQSVACLSRVDHTRIARGILGPEEREAAMRASNALSRMPFYRADPTTPGCPRTVAALGAALAALPSPPALVIVDHVGKLRPRGRFYKDRRDAVAEVSNDLVMLARQTGAAILALAHISRDGSDRPTLEHLADSDALGKDADGVVLMHRDDLAPPPPKRGGKKKVDPDEEELAKPEPGVALVAAVKVRGSSVNAVCRMRLRGEWQRWDPMDLDADDWRGTLPEVAF